MSSQQACLKAVQFFRESLVRQLYLLFLSLYLFQIPNQTGEKIKPNQQFRFSLFFPTEPQVKSRLLFGFFSGLLQLATFIQSKVCSLFLKEATTN